MLHFEPFAGSLDEWGQIHGALPDRSVFQTPAWMRFVAESQGATPVIAVLKDRNDTVGYFAGLTVRKFGLKILGSPFVGWTTTHMGIRLLRDVPKREAAEALTQFAFQHLKCIHMEFSDPKFTPQDVAELGFQCRNCYGYVVDLTQNEEQLFGNMNSSARRYCNRKGPKRGVTVEEASDDAFVDDYYSQLQEVFAKQGLVPTYGKQRIRLLLRHLLPTGNLLLLRARDSLGHCIATGVFLGMNRYAYFWGNASWRQTQHLRPNEPLHWYAMCYWKSRGISYYDMCGSGLYKQKYGGQPVETYYLRKSRHLWIAVARNVAGQGYRLYQRIAGLHKRLPRVENETDGCVLN